MGAEKFVDKSLNSTSRSQKSQKSDATARPSRTSMSFAIKNTEELFAEVREIVYNMSNVWSWRHDVTTLYRMRLPGMVEVDVGGDKYTVHRFFLEDTPSFNFTETTTSLSHTGVTEALRPPVSVVHATPNFPHVLTLLKLRWLLKLHSGGCEMDNKLCSVARLIAGFRYIIVQQFADAEADSGFDHKVDKNGAELNVNSTLDDFVEQLQRAMGTSFASFVGYVSSCDPRRCLNTSSTDTFLPPRITSNDKLYRMLDEIWIAYLLKGDHQKNRLRDVLQDLEAYRVPLPKIPLLRLDKVREWAVSTTWATKKLREKAAQLQVSLACAAVEMGELDVYGTVQKLEEDTVDLFGDTMRSRGWEEVVPKIKMDNFLMQMVMVVCAHHNTFPEGIRERLLHLVLDYGVYEVSEEDRHKLLSCMAIKQDEKLLSFEALEQIKQKEQERLHRYTETYFKDTTPLLAPPLVQMPLEQSKDAPYTKPVKHRPRGRMEPDQSVSLPNLGAALRHPEKFMVPKITGPLTWDNERGKFRTTGYFQRMGNTSMSSLTMKERTLLGIKDF